jgi:hypothetical protein
VRVKVRCAFESHRSSLSCRLGAGSGSGPNVPKKARNCGHCEADLAQAPSALEAAAVMELVEQMPADVLAELGTAMSKSASALDFAKLIMVGPCPTCGSEQTGDWLSDRTTCRIGLSRSWVRLWLGHSVAADHPLEPLSRCCSTTQRWAHRLSSSVHLDASVDVTRTLAAPSKRVSFRR